jgi:hypothetical protein
VISIYYFHACFTVIVQPISPGGAFIEISPWYRSLASSANLISVWIAASLYYVHASMNHSVVSLILADNQVLVPTIASVFVDVVHAGHWRQWLAESFFCNDYVFQDITVAV